MRLAPNPGAATIEVAAECRARWATGGAATIEVAAECRARWATGGAATIEVAAECRARWATGLRRHHPPTEPQPLVKIVLATKHISC